MNKNKLVGPIGSLFFMKSLMFVQLVTSMAVFSSSEFVLAQSGTLSGKMVERVVEASTPEKNQIQAKRILFDKALEQVSEEMIQEIIGETKMARNRSLINEKIIRRSGRFIPFSRPGEMTPLPEGFKMVVILKVNVEELQKMLRENGLFYDSDSTPAVMPAVRWINRITGHSSAWWVPKSADSSVTLEENGLLARQSLQFENLLRKSFTKHNFYVSRPESFRLYQLLPKAFQTETLRVEDWQILGPTFQSQVVVEGEVEISKSERTSDAYGIGFHLRAFQIMNGRIIAEVVRVFETQTGPMDFVVEKKLKEVTETVVNDLSSQVLDAWQRGAIGASLYKLTIRGRLPIQQQEIIKEQFKNRFKELKSINERLIGMDSIVYEIDSALNPRDLTQKIQEMRVGQYQLKLESANEKEAVYRALRDEGAGMQKSEEAKQ